MKQQLTNTGSSVGDIRTVIDGQQRLTTISILLKVLCLKTDTLKKFDKRFRLDDDSMVLKHNFNDIKAYNDIMALEEILPTSDGNNISRAYQFFVKHLDTNKVDFDTICNSILFVGIDLSVDEDEQQIFDTINSLGVRLTTAELLKNYFFSRNNISDYKTYWQEVFEKDEKTRHYWDQEITTGRIKRTFIDLFFYAFLQIKIQNTDIPVSSDDKIIFSKVDKLFDSYKMFVKKYLGGNNQLLFQEIKEYATTFRNAINLDVINNELTSEAGIERINAVMFALDTTTLIPYVLFAEHNISDVNARSDLYSYIESYIMRRLITRQTTKNYNQLFTDRLILNKVLSKDALAEYISGQEDKINRMPSDKEVLDAFHESCLTNKYALGVLYLIESKIRDRSKHSTQLLGISKYSLEHMMPKKWQNSWQLSKDCTVETRDRKLLTLGNLTIITQSLNASIRDADWQTKKAGKKDKGGLKKYAEGIETLSEYLELDSWDENSIKKRADDLANKALNVWEI